MADDQDRRVEPRGAIAGSGMLTDPERIDALQAEAARRERAWRRRPGKGFSDVLQARHEEAEDDAEPQEAAAQSPSSEEAKAEEDEEEAMAVAAAAVPDEISGLSAAPPAAPPAAIRRAPPDPRMAALHQLVDGNAPRAQAKRTNSRADHRAGGRPRSAKSSVSKKRRSP